MSASRSSSSICAIRLALADTTFDGDSGTFRVAVLNFSIAKSGEISAGSASTRTAMP